MAATRDFASRRLHSLLGVIPLGVFLFQHLTVNYFATRGPEAFNKAASFISNLPYLYVLEWVIIYLPLLFHGIYGVYIAFQSKNNASKYGYFRNVMFLLQRVSGIISLIFIAWHIWQTRIQVMFGQEVNYDMMHEILTNPGWLIFYLIGVITVIFHFSNGLWSFCVSFGFIVTPNSQRVFTYVSLIVFIILAIIGVSAILAFV
ncbi:succinate dehydrogenase [Pueribacillus theae]|uniref:Succinate dehydrogenase n=1 Tax=Pueribacillus theae TaxID=2171751 RepID=A0A2U1K5L9_9BACI|nr:succinate dehydrogenase cytochrome b558 subunit [Pueribacillus theae]PWA12293.1 succinate dehydrogenase [Pueribacillus theae]